MFFFLQAVEGEGHDPEEYLFEIDMKKVTSK